MVPRESKLLERPPERLRGRSERPDEAARADSGRAAVDVLKEHWLSERDLLAVERQEPKHRLPVGPVAAGHASALVMATTVAAWTNANPTRIVARTATRSLVKKMLRSVVTSASSRTTSRTLLASVPYTVPSGT